jgi:hypothetical protein
MDSQEAKSLRYLGQIVDFRLNYCLEGKNLKIKSSGTKSQKPGLPLHLLLSQGMFWGLKITERSHASRFNI